MEDDKYVYHGSHEKFEDVVPKRNKRIRVSKKTGIEEVIFDEVSFHATPYKWIALAYTYSQKYTNIDGKDVYYNMGVDLYDYRKELVIYGVKSLDSSLEQLYGDGGYLYYFNKEDFFHKEGLGNLERIIQKNITPVNIERIENPLNELKKEGVKFTYVDLSLEENIKYKNYKS